MCRAPFESRAMSENSPTLLDEHPLAQTPEIFATNGLVKFSWWENSSPTVNSNEVVEEERAV